MATRVVVCDDHELIRYIVREILSGTPDISVIGEAQDGEGAVRMTGDLAPDVVIMDMEMDGMAGIEATKQIAVQTPGVRVLALSGNTDWPQVVAMLAAGAVGYLVKPWSMSEIIRAVRAVAAGETYLSGTLRVIAGSDPINGFFGKLFSAHFRPEISSLPVQTNPDAADDDSGSSGLMARLICPR
jgi:DNA-binding NarL/FixJ family response regulator